eukprot:PhM_4_TR9491/c5_g1_i1/m.26021/K00655/plsC; 1-acyl-sn-glycerol-3-phosphate acyltransferase
MCCCSLAFYLLIFMCVIPQITKRVCPRAWFTFTAVLMGVFLGLSSFLTDSLRHVGVAADHRQGLLKCCVGSLFWVWLKLNPQVTLTEHGSNTIWSDVPRGAYVLANHMSFLDSLVVTTTMPFSQVWDVRTMYKASLSKIPLAGSLFANCGHFPVYFTGKGDGEYGVDKARQASVSAAFETYVKEQKGFLVMFPEGSMNKEPTTLLPFRHGSFVVATKYKAPMYAFVMTGCNKTWPRHSNVGGAPSEIKYRLVKLDIDYENDDALKGEDGYRNVAEACQAQMQKHLDSLLLLDGHDEKNKQQ